MNHHLDNSGAPTKARKRRAAWTPADEATLRDLTGEGRTDAQIAARMARDVKLIGKKRRALNIDRGVPPALAALMARVNSRRSARA